MSNDCFGFEASFFRSLAGQSGGQVSFGPGNCPVFQIPCSLKRGGQNLGFGIVCSGILHWSDSNQHQVKPVLAGPCHDVVNDRVPRIISGPAPGHLPDRNHAALGVASDLQAAFQGCRCIVTGHLSLERPGSTGFIESFKQGNQVGGKPLGELVESQILPGGRCLWTEAIERLPAMM